MTDSKKRFRDWFQEKFDILLENQLEMSKDITSLKTCLAGDSEMKTEGLVQCHRNLKKRVSKLERVIYMIIGASLVIDAVIIILTKYLQNVH
jgi:hypothetical protein